MRGGRGSFYARTPTVNTDGSLVFQNAADERNQREVADVLSRHWQCELRSWGTYEPIDWYAVRHGHMVALLELKCRALASTTFDTVFLSVRKWDNLRLTAMWHDVPGVFVVRFTDGLRWVFVADIDARQIAMGGTAKIHTSPLNQEPVILVPVAAMKTIRERP